MTDQTPICLHTREALVAELQQHPRTVVGTAVALSSFALALLSLTVVDPGNETRSYIFDHLVLAVALALYVAGLYGTYRRIKVDRTPRFQWGIGLALAGTVAIIGLSYWDIYTTPVFLLVLAPAAGALGALFLVPMFAKFTSWASSAMGFTNLYYGTRTGTSL